MIIDLHTHYIDFEKEAGDILRKDMANSGISTDMWCYSEDEYLKGVEGADRVVVFGLKAKKTGWLFSNTHVADFANRLGNRFIFFASIDPTEPDAMGELKFLHREKNCKGVKLGPVYQGVHPLDARYDPIYEYCQKHGLPIMTHMATTFSSGVPLDYARPVHMDEVACRYPDLRMILAHIGHPWEGETLAVIRRHKNVFADISALYYRPWQFYNSMRLAVEYNCTGKLLFGSDYPATTTASSIEGLRKVNQIAAGSGLPLIPVEVIEDIIHRNSLELIGIDD